MKQAFWGKYTLFQRVRSLFTAFHLLLAAHLARMSFCLIAARVGITLTEQISDPGISEFFRFNPGIQEMRIFQILQSLFQKICVKIL